MSKSPHKFIVIEGPLGVGKTTLAHRLAESFGSDLLLEDADDNPFLERFYKEPRNVALQTQLFFLFQRAKQIEELRQSDLFQPVRVADFILEKDRLFAELTLDEEEFKLYDQVYRHLSLQAPSPDLVIYLQAPVEVLLRRVAKRGRRYEQPLSSDYLARLNEAYTRFFYDYHASPLLIVNAAEIDFAENEQDYQLILDYVCKIQSGRHYLNPSQIAL